MKYHTAWLHRAGYRYNYYGGVRAWREIAVVHLPRWWRRRDWLVVSLYDNEILPGRTGRSEMVVSRWHTEAEAEQAAEKIWNGINKADAAYRMLHRENERNEDG